MGQTDNLKKAGFNQINKIDRVAKTRSKTLQIRAGHNTLCNGREYCRTTTKSNINYVSEFRGAIRILLYVLLILIFFITDFNGVLVHIRISL